MIYFSPLPMYMRFAFLCFCHTMRIMEKHSYHIVLFAEPEGGYTVTVPALPGCVSYGRSLEEARDMAADAIRGYLASMRKRKETLPPPTDAVLTTVTV